MCVIIHLRPKKILDKKILQNCYDNNPDGWGIMSVIDGKYQIVRSMQSFDIFEKSLADFSPEVVRAIHFRIRTRGDISINNVHPFRVSDNLWMMHNGTLDIDSTATESDSKIWAEKSLNEVIHTWERLTDDRSALTHNEFISMVEEHTDGSRILFMDGNGKVDRSFKSMWHKAHGVRFSNSYSHNKKYVYKTYSYNSNYDTSYRDWDQFDLEKGQFKYKNWSKEEREAEIAKRKADKVKDIAKEKSVSGEKSVHLFNTPHYMLEYMQPDDPGVEKEERDFLNAGDETTKNYSDLLPYGREDVLDSVDIPAPTIKELMNMTDSELMDFCIDNPDIAAFVIRDLLTRPWDKIGYA